MSPEFEALFCKHAILGFQKQLALAEVIGERAWIFETQSGNLTFAKQGFFGKPLTFSVQILGTVSTGDETWMWSWANEASGLAASITSSAESLRNAALTPEFTEPVFSLSLDSGDDHRVVMAAVGALGGDAYYRGPYEGGAAYFMIQDERIRLPRTDLIKVTTLVPEVISAVPVQDHRTAILAYAEQRGFEIIEQGSDVLLSHQGQQLEVSFDTKHRLTGISGHVS